MLNIYLNNNLIFRVCSENGGGGGYYELNNFNKEYSTPINQKNNQIQIDLINSGGLFSCRNLTISYYYEWITN